MVCTSDERAIIPAEKGGSTIMRSLPYPHYSPFSSYQLQLNAQLGQIYHTLIKFSVVEITDNPCLAPPFSKHIDTPDEEKEITGPSGIFNKKESNTSIHTCQCKCIHIHEFLCTFQYTTINWIRTWWCHLSTFSFSWPLRVLSCLLEAEVNTARCSLVIIADIDI